MNFSKVTIIDRQGGQHEFCLALLQVKSPVIRAMAEDIKEGPYEFQLGANGAAIRAFLRAMAVRPVSAEVC